MSRVARVVLPGFPHHVTQRGNRRTNIFVNRSDRDFYLSLIREAAERFGVSFRAYCLMTNHVHFVAVPEHPKSLAKAFHRAHTRYANWFNETYHLSGHLFEDRPHSSPLDELHYWASLRYVECNPVRARMVRSAEDYPWSSAAAHCGLRQDSILNPAWTGSLDKNHWSQWLAEDEPEKEYGRIRERTHTGHPCGSDEFVRRIEKQLGRSFIPRKPGPKPK